MILNQSRYSDYNSCRQLAFNKHHRRLAGRTSTSMADGSAFHSGVATGLATRDWLGAGLVEAKKTFDEEISKANLLPAEEYLKEDNWELTQLMLELYKSNYEQEDYQIIQPEAEFRVPLSDEKHSCVMRHWKDTETGEDHWEPAPAELILSKRVADPHKGETNEERAECPCWTPHEVVGKIDGIFLWRGAMWIMDHKTTALPPPAFWSQWALSYQPTIYLYGAQKALGIRPSGFIINAVFKPSEAQVSAWNNKRKSGAPKGPKDYLKYEREAFIRSDEDIERARRDFISIADEWEWRILRGEFPLSPSLSTCHNYNKTCQFEPLCTNHAEPNTLAAYPIRSEYDYVEKNYYPQPLVQIASGEEQQDRALPSRSE